MKKMHGLVAGALALALSLSACQAEELPTPETPSAPATPAAVLDVDQVETILGDIRSSLARADASSTASEFEDRLTGPAAQMREAEYRLASNSGGENPVTVLDTAAQITAVAATDTWPRVISVVTEIPTDANLPLLLTIVQDDARSKYKLWSWVRLFPGIQVPELTNPAGGSPMVEPDSSALAVSPKDAVEQYVDVVLKNDESEFAAKFEADPFRTKFHETANALREAISGVGTVEESTSTNEVGTRSIATHDGGAIVVGVYDQRLVVSRTTAGSTLTVGKTLAYGGDGNVKGTLTAQYLTTVALYVPPAGSEEKIVPIGAEQVLTSVELDESTSPD